MTALWIDSCPASCGPASSPCCRRHRRAPAAASPPCPRPQLRGRVAVYGPHLHPWNLLPAKELGCGSATTCWRRLDEWVRAGVFEQLQAVLLDELGEAGRLDLERVLVDSASVRAVKGGADRRKPGRPRQAGDQAAPGRRRRRPAKLHGDKGVRHEALCDRVG